MVICEISENIEEIKNNTRGIKNTTTYKSHDDRSIIERLTNQPSQTHTWVCNCGTRNNEEDNFCKNCGKSPSLNDKAPVRTPSQSNWRCPKCGKSNPSSSRVCKDCGYEK